MLLGERPLRLGLAPVEGAVDLLVEAVEDALDVRLGPVVDGFDLARDLRPLVLVLGLRRALAGADPGRGPLAGSVHLGDGGLGVAPGRVLGPLELGFLLLRHHRLSGLYDVVYNPVVTALKPHSKDGAYYIPSCGACPAHPSSPSSSSALASWRSAVSNPSVNQP